MSLSPRLPETVRYPTLSARNSGSCLPDGQSTLARSSSDGGHGRVCVCVGRVTGRAIDVIDVSKMFWHVCSGGASRGCLIQRQTARERARSGGQLATQPSSARSGRLPAACPLDADALPCKRKKRQVERKRRARLIGTLDGRRRTPAREYPVTLHWKPKTEATIARVKGGVE